MQNTASELVSVGLADAKTGKVVETIAATPEHPFFTSRGMVAAKDLGIGTEILTRAGPQIKDDKAAERGGAAGATLIVAQVTRQSAKSTGGAVPVFNFEVEDFHTYFVGTAQGGAWVHNDCTDIAKKIIAKRGEGTISTVVLKSKVPFFFNGAGAAGRYGYHDVVRVGDKIIDRYTLGHNRPVPFAEWKKAFDNAVGGSGDEFDVFFDIHPGSGRGVY